MKTKSKKKPSGKMEYKPMKKVDKTPAIKERAAYSGEAYELYCSIRWDKAWTEFLTLDEEGKFKYRSALQMAKHLAKGVDEGDSRKRASLLFKSIGPSEAKDISVVPYIGDWEALRSSLFIGEVQKESLLFGNPKVETIRELVKNHIDVMETAKGIGELMVDWLARYQMFSQQIDEHFGYKLFDPDLDDDANEKRFKRYTRMQEYMFSRTIDATTELLRCFGVGKDDVSMLTQMMIAAMKGKLGEQTSNMMIAASTGMSAKTLDGMSLGGGVEKTSDSDPFQTPALKSLIGTFAAKAAIFKMEHPDIDIPGAKPEDMSTDPTKKMPVAEKTKTNGKHKQVN